MYIYQKTNVKLIILTNLILLWTIFVEKNYRFYKKIENVNFLK
jgi:hypothetical protein